MTGSFRLLAGALVLTTSCLLASAQEAKTPDPAAPGEEAAAPPGVARAGDESRDPEQARLEQKFAETLTGATLVGYFTDTSTDKPPAEEKYTISKVTKLQGDRWLFAARIQFGGRDVSVPLVLPVKWAGDTPVITVTDVGIPGLGTYTARVLIYDDQYAGTWQGGDHGGHLWGRIERAKDDKPAAGKSGEQQPLEAEPPGPQDEQADGDESR